MFWSLSCSSPPLKRDKAFLAFQLLVTKYHSGNEGGEGTSPQHSTGPPRSLSDAAQPNSLQQLTISVLSRTHPQIPLQTHSKEIQSPWWPPKAAQAALSPYKKRVFPQQMSLGTPCGRKDLPLNYKQQHPTSGLSDKVLLQTPLLQTPL